ncbi:14413_t:CDS:2, partial [Gigaspora margarita]
NKFPSNEFRKSENMNQHLIFCLVLGDTVRKSFSVIIDKGATIGHLKQLIKKTKDPVHNNVSADNFELYAVWTFLSMLIKITRKHYRIQEHPNAAVETLVSDYNNYNICIIVKPPSVTTEGLGETSMKRKEYGLGYEGLDLNNIDNICQRKESINRLLRYPQITDMSDEEKIIVDKVLFKKATYLQDHFGNVARPTSPKASEDFIKSVFSKMIPNYYKIEKIKGFHINDWRNSVIELLRDGEKLNKHKERFHEVARTHKLVIQTSPKQATRFETLNFELNIGHISLVHRDRVSDTVIDVYGRLVDDQKYQFLIYQTSTLLNMKFEALSRQRGNSNIELDNLSIDNAIRGNNSQNLPEDKIIFYIQCKHIGATSMHGDPIPYGIDDSIWKIANFAVVLSLIERAEVLFN